MTLLRASARTLLASYFVISGVKALRKPDQFVAAAQPLADKVVPLVKRYAPDEVASVVPEDTRTLVRINGATQVLGGLALATGNGRRLGALLLAGSLVPSTLAKHQFWSESDPERKAEATSHFVKNLSLLGGVLLAAGDTEGRPSLAYRAHKSSQHLARDTRKASKRAQKKLSAATGVGQSQLAKTADSLGDNLGDAADVFSAKASDLADGVLAGGAALLAAGVAGSRKARKQAGKQLKKSQGEAAKQFAELQKQAATQARAGGKAGRKQLEVAKKEGAKRFEAAQKEAAKQLKAGQKKARKVRKNIQLGEN